MSYEILNLFPKLFPADKGNIHGDISTLFDNDFEIESKYHLNIVSCFLNSTYLQFTRRLYSECVFQYVFCSFLHKLLIPSDGGLSLVALSVQ